MRSAAVLIYYAPYRQRLVLGSRHLDCRRFSNAYSARHWAIRSGLNFVLADGRASGRGTGGASAPTGPLPCPNSNNSIEGEAERGGRGERKGGW